MSLQALVVVETAAGAHGPLLKKRKVLKKHMSNMNHPYPETSDFLTETLSSCHEIVTFTGLLV